MTLLSERLAILNEHLAMPKLKLPTSIDRRLLAYLHSGEVVRHFLPKLLRVTAVMGLVFYVIAWLLFWPTIYEEFERWGLVQAFFAQMLALATAFLITRITILRAGHLEAFPADDFVVLRTMAVLSRWVAEVVVVFVLGMWLSFVLLTLPLLLAGSAFPIGDSEVVMSIVIYTTIAALAVTPFFLFCYTIAAVIDLSLAIEFNTRAERLGK